jgi:cytochrome c peroxidase
VYNRIFYTLNTINTINNVNAMKHIPALKRLTICLSLTVVAAAILALVSCGGGNGSNTAAMPADEAELTPQQLLGKRIFFDTNLSEPRGMSCASCHEANKGFSGNNGSHLGVALGSRPNVFGMRNTPAASYAMYSPAFSFATGAPIGGQFLDGRTDTLAQQAAQPFLGAVEMNNPSKAAVVAKINAGQYANLFKQVFGEQSFTDTDKAFEQATLAIQAFETTSRFTPFTSKYDQVLAGKAAFTPNEAQGLQLFMNKEKGNCVACHVADPTNKDPKQSLFTDFSYDAFGVPRNTAIPLNAKADFFDLGLCGPGRTDLLTGINADPKLCGKFKVPSLRNTAKKVAWMHNGYFKNLNDVVSFYATRDTNPEKWYPNGVKFDDLPAKYQGNVNTTEIPYDRKLGETPRLNPTEVALIVQFLQTLND